MFANNAKRSSVTVFIGKGHHDLYFNKVKEFDQKNWIPDVVFKPAVK